ncbi:MAG: MYXO-CTERM sorting domain-containing protein [Polyangiaceae bacterium]|nr:MYXO-CTERM sorting domain-containing protein [Polyangiaceae bacterium]
MSAGNGSLGNGSGDDSGCSVATRPQPTPWWALAGALGLAVARLRRRER